MNPSRVLWVPNIHVVNLEQKSKRRFNSIKTFPGTRKNHCFIASNGNQMTMKKTSFDEDEVIVPLEIIFKKYFKID